MAQIRLYRREVKEGRLPRVCMRCGAEADEERARNFAWYPPWVNLLVLIGVLPAAIVASILTKRMKVYAPLCTDHRNHWLLRNLVTYGGLVAMIFLGILAGMVLAATDQGPGRARGSILPGLVCMGSILLLLVWLISAAIMGSTAIRPKEITDKTITLAGVCDEFVRAIEEMEDEDDDRPSRPRPRVKEQDIDGSADLGEPRRRRPSSGPYDKEDN